VVLFEWTLCLLFAAVFLARLADRLRVPYPVFLVLAGAKAASDGDGRSVSPRQDARLKALEAQRARLWDLRQGGAIGDHAYHRLEAEFDLVELESSP